MDCNVNNQHLVIASYVTTLDSNNNILCRACVPVTDSIHFKVLFDKKLYDFALCNELYLLYCGCTITRYTVV